MYVYVYIYMVCEYIIYICIHIHTYIHTYHTIPYHTIPYHTIPLHYITLHYISFHYITLHYIQIYIYTVYAYIWKERSHCDWPSNQGCHQEILAGTSGTWRQPGGCLATSSPRIRHLQWHNINGCFLNHQNIGGAHEFSTNSRYGAQPGTWVVRGVLKKALRVPITNEATNFRTWLS